MPVEDGELTSDTSIATFTNYLWTIIYMPMSLRVLCVTNLFCWMSLVCYSLYFTDFVGEAVFQGDPSVSFQSPFFMKANRFTLLLWQAAPGSEKRRLYDEGVQFGCWGMALYSLSCSFYSFAIEKLVKRFRYCSIFQIVLLLFDDDLWLIIRAKPVYICGQLVYSIGMVFMAMARSKWGVILFSWSAGIMYSTLFTMPYLIVAHYHETDCVS